MQQPVLLLNNIIAQIVNKVNNPKDSFLLRKDACDLLFQFVKQCFCFVKIHSFGIMLFKLKM